MFLDIKPFPKEMLPAKERELSNWLKIADSIYSSENMLHILRVLQLELRGLRRQYVINRVYSRFSAVRAKEEKTHMREFFSILEPLWDDEEEITRALKNWHTMQIHLKKKYRNASHIKGLLYREYRGKKRPYMMKRLYGKFSMQRMKKEKKEMMRWKPKDK